MSHFISSEFMASMPSQPPDKVAVPKGAELSRVRGAGARLGLGRSNLDALFLPQRKGSCGDSDLERLSWQILQSPAEPTIS